MKMRLNQEKCIGCYACYVACIAEHNPPEAEDAYSYRTIKTSVKDGLQKKVCVGCIQCGACMFNRKYVLSRIDRAKKQRIPMTNYGVTIAHLTGSLPHVVMP